MRTLSLVIPPASARLTDVRSSFAAGVVETAADHRGRPNPLRVSTGLTPSRQ